MKTPSSDLFNLIKSLDTQEKVQFKLFASRKKTNSSYVKLFNAIDGQKKYDEAAIKKILKDESLIKNLDSTKTYVTETILKCLQEYYSSDTVEAALCNYIQQIEILTRKNLYVQVKKIIRKAEILALTHHQHPYLFTILSWKRRVMTGGLFMKEFELYQNEHYLRESHSIEVYKNVVEYQRLFIKTSGMMIRQDNSGKEVEKELNEILRNNLLADESHALSYPAKVLYQRILGDIYFLFEDAKKSYLHLKKAIEYAELARLSINETINMYSIAMILLYKLKNNKDLLLLKNKAVSLVKSLPPKLLTTGLSRQYKALMQNYIHFQLSIGNVREALILSDEIRELMNKERSIQSLMVYQGNLSMIAFYMDDFRQALQYANKVLANEKKGVRQDMIASVKIFTLVIHYELGNLNMLANLCRSVRLFIGKEYGSGETEKIILRFFGKSIHKAGSNKDIVNAFLELKTELEANKIQKTIVDFDFISWAESKIKNKKLTDIIKKKTEMTR